MITSSVVCPFYCFRRRVNYGFGEKEQSLLHSLMSINRKKIFWRTCIFLFFQLHDFCQTNILDGHNYHHGESTINPLFLLCYPAAQMHSKLSSFLVEWKGLARVFMLKIFPWKEFNLNLVVLFHSPLHWKYGKVSPKLKRIETPLLPSSESFFG